MIMFVQGSNTASCLDTEVTSSNAARVHQSDSVGLVTNYTARGKITRTPSMCQYQKHVGNAERESDA